MIEIDHSYTNQIVCPYCGYEHCDSWEYDSDSGDIECAACERAFFYERHVDVSYNTSPVMGPHRQSEMGRAEEAEQLERLEQAI